MTPRTLPGPRRLDRSQPTSAATGYSLARPFLELLPPERAHALALLALRVAGGIGRIQPINAKSQALDSCGLGFPNRVGLAAGLDKNAIAVAGLARLGFGFIEVGTVTPRPQPGQPPPRLFRLRHSAALVNRMGFPNDGADVIAGRLAKARRRGVSLPIGVNIGKNATTPLERAVDDYLAGLRALHRVADYIAVNVSSPNTTGLRDLQESQRLEPILTALLEERRRLTALGGRENARPVPLLVKLSPDLSDEAFEEAGLLVRRLGIDGVIATNSTLQRDGLALDPRDGARSAEAGGLSGAPLRDRALHAVRRLRAALGPKPLLIGVGGIQSPADARAMRAAGADLVQLYTGLIVRGPALVRECIDALDGSDDSGVRS